MLAAQGRNPKVVGRNRRSGYLQFGTDRPVGNGGSFVDVQNPEIPQVFGQPSFVKRTVARLKNAESEFAENNDRNGEVRGLTQDGLKRLVSLR